MKLLQIILFIFLFSFSCTQTNECECTPSEKKMSLKSVHTYKLHIDTATTYKFSQLEVLDTDSGLIVFGYDRNTLKFFFYHLENDLLLSTAQIKHEGVGSIPESPFYFSIFSPDSLFCIQQSPIVLYRVNAQAQVLEKYKISDILPNGISDPIANTGKESPLIYDPKTNCFIFEVNYYENPLKHFTSASSVVFDLTTQKYKNMQGFYSSEYGKEAEEQHCYGFKDVFARVLNAERNVVYSFAISPQLYVYNFNTGKCIDTVCAQSQYITKPIKSIPFPPASSLQDEINHNITEPTYINLIFDSYRNIYLRIIKHAQELRNSQGEMNNELSAKWSIMFFDNKFQLIDEFEFSNNIYNFNNIFIVEKGVVIGKNNPNNPDEQEGVLEFELFEVK